jgi:hypothetical protein
MTVWCTAPRVMLPDLDALATFRGGHPGSHSYKDLPKRNLQLLVPVCYCFRQSRGGDRSKSAQ